MRRAVMAVVFVGIVAGLALWQLPGRKGDAALAAVAQAMARVESAYLSGVQVDSHGDLVQFEAWVRGPSKYRERVEGISDEIDDGERFISMNLQSTPVVVHISRPRGLPGAEEGMTYLDLFKGPQALRQALATEDSRLVRSEETVLSDGRAAIVLEVDASGRKSLLTIDASTDLVISCETLGRDGELISRIERIDYRVDVPDEVFQADIPEGAIVVDSLPTEATREQRARYEGWIAAAKRLPDAVVLSSISPGQHGCCGTPFHRRLMFEVAGDGGMVQVYLPERNAYRIFGKAMVHEDGNQMNPGPVVEDAEYVAPSPPDVTVAQWRAEEARQNAEMERHMPTPEMRAKWDAKARELKAMGAKHLCQCGGDCCPAGNLYGGRTFEALDHDVDLWYSPERGEYYVMGKARVHGWGTDQVVEDDWIKVPGPAPKLPKE